MKKRLFALFLSMLLIFSSMPTIALATEVEEETAAVEVETEEETAAAEAETEEEAAAAEAETEEEAAAAEEDTEEETDVAEAETTTLLLASASSVAATNTESRTDTEEETLCDHGNSQASCPVCALEEQSAALPALEEIAAMIVDEEEALYAQASALADVYYDDLTETEQAQVSNIDALWDILDYFSVGLTLTASSADTDWYNSTSTYFTITTAAELAGLASLVNAGNDFSGKTIYLGATIDLGSEDWTPIGTNSYPFKGTFDGKGYTVKNISVSGGTYAGLFGYVDGSAVIKKVTVTGTVSGASFAGGIVGYITSGVTIESCTNSASLSLSGYSGGVVGWNNGGTVTGCSNSGSVSNSSDVGSAGGVVGYNDTYAGIITNCYNTGAVSMSNTKYYVGGITGRNRQGEVTNCYNTGTVSGGYHNGSVAGLNESTLSNNYYLSATASTADDGEADARTAGRRSLPSAAGHTVIRPVLRAPWRPAYGLSPIPITRMRTAPP